MKFQTLYWHCRWWADKRWRESIKRRVLKAKADAEFVSKPFRMTALRKFVMDRL